MHSVAEELGDELCVRSLAAACAGAGELEERLLELGALYGAQSEGQLLLGSLCCIVEDGLILSHLVDGLHDQSLVLCGADVDAGAAAGAVHGRCDDDQFVFLAALAVKLAVLSACGSVCDLFLAVSEGADSCMGADQRALAALDAVCGDPLGSLNADAALLKGSGALRNCAVSHIHKCGNGQEVAAHVVYGSHDAVNVLLQVDAVGIGNAGNGVGSGILPGLGDGDLNEAFKTCINCSVVHVDDLLALVAVGSNDSVLHVLYSVLDGEDTGELEECGLEDHIGAAAKTDLACDLDCVHGVELDVVLGKVLLGGGGQAGGQLFNAPTAVEQEGAAGLDILNDVIALDVRGSVAGDEVSLVDIVGGLDGAVAEAQVGDGYAAGLLGVILEVGLNLLVGVVADDFDAVLVSANGTVGAETPELAGNNVIGSAVGLLGDGQGQVGNVVHDADGEGVYGLVALGVGESGDDGAGSGVLAAKTVAATDGGHAAAACACKSGGNVQIKGLTDAAGLLGAVKNNNGLNGLGQSSCEVLDAEGTVQANLYKADLFALGVEVVNYFLSCIANAAHSYHNFGCVGSAVVVEELVVGAQAAVDFVHVFFNNSGEVVVSGVGCLAVLEEDVAVLGGAAEDGVSGHVCAGAECGNGILIQHFTQFIVIPDFDLLQLVRGAETVEEVEEGNSSLDACKVSNCAQVHYFLGAVGAEHSVTGAAAAHNVGVVAEDGKGMGSQSAGGNVDNAGLLFAGDLIHVGDHQQQTLRSGEGGGQRAGYDGAVNSACCAALGLHLNNSDGLIEKVLASVSGPFIDHLCHNGRGGDGVDGSNIGKRIGYVSRSGVAVHGFQFSCHKNTSIYIGNFLLSE